jgi:hypothetical protein
MTPEELEAHQARKAERSAKKAEEAEAAAAVAAGEPAEAPAKRKGRIWTPEQKEAAKAKRAQTMAAKKAAASEPVDLSSGLQGDWAILSSRPPSPDVSFYPHTIDGVSFFTNDRGDLVTESFEWVGRLVGGKIDEGVLEPADLAHATMRAESERRKSGITCKKRKEVSAAAERHLARCRDGAMVRPPRGRTG